MVLLKLFRALGKYNEFERVDRDQFVLVMWENIEPGENTRSLLTYVYISRPLFPAKIKFCCCC